ncbi:MAG: terminase small subunit [Vicinamibacterales bacterium]
MVATRHRGLNRTQISAFFGVSPTTIDAWINRGCPVVRRPRGRGSANGWQIDSAAAAEWLRGEASASRSAGQSSIGEASHLLGSAHHDEFDKARSSGSIATRSAQDP